MDQSWTIVHFIKENSVEAVPTTWIVGNKCYWPAFPADKVDKAIKNHEHSSSCWESFEIRIFRNATYGIIFIPLFVSELVNLYTILGDVSKMASASYLLLTHVVQILKYCYLHHYSERIKVLKSKANRREFQPKTSYQRKILRDYIKYSKVITIIFWLACIATCSFWGVNPFVEESVRLPLPGWFPFDIGIPRYFVIAYAYQLSTTTINGIIIIGMDTLMTGFFFMGIVIGEIINWYFSLGDLEAMVTASFLTLSNVVSIAKFYIIARYQKKILKLAVLINRKEFKPKSQEQRQTLEEYIKMSKVISGLMYGGCLFTCTFWAIYPFTEDVDAFLPIAAWIPFKTDTSPYFEIVFVYEIIATVIGGLTDLSADCLIAGFIMVICAQLKILNDSLVNIRQFSLKEMMNETQGKNIDGRISAQLQNIMNKKLMECVIHHRYILEFAEEVTFLFTTSILGQFAVSAIIICTTLFEMNLVPFTSVKFFSLILYQYCMLMEIFIVCYFGNEVILESSKLTNFAYHCDWHDCSQEFKKNLVFFMTRSQRALKLYAGGFFTLSLDTFVRILKSSWSYFVVLIQVNKEEI